ncbi:MAG: MscL family protein [Bacilli bacterium]
MSEERRKKRKEKRKKIIQDFTKFISRGSVIDMAVGVVIGGAFGAIVTSLVGILLSVSTWGVPGGLSGLVTVLPALNPSQTATTLGWENVYSFSDFAAKAEEIGGMSSQEAQLFMNAYTQRGNTFYYKGCAIIDWGSFINAIITFLIVALTLFIILKTFNYLQAKRLAIEEKIKEQYYVKHPDERPVPEEPKAPAPTEVELLTEIRDALKSKPNKDKDK